MAEARRIMPLVVRDGTEARREVNDRGVMVIVVYVARCGH